MLLVRASPERQFLDEPSAQGSDRAADTDPLMRLEVWISQRSMLVDLTCPKS